MRNDEEKADVKIRRPAERFMLEPVANKKKRHEITLDFYCRYHLLFCMFYFFKNIDTFMTYFLASHRFKH